MACRSSASPLSLTQTTTTFPHNAQLTSDVDFHGEKEPKNPEKTLVPQKKTSLTRAFGTTVVRRERRHVCSICHPCYQLVKKLSTPRKVSSKTA